MKKSQQSYKSQKIRTRYEDKRRTRKWKRKKHFAKINRHIEKIAKEKYFHKPFTKHTAPQNMSLIDNTDEVLNYFNNAHKLFKQKEKVEFDIEEISNLTPDAITLLIAKINDDRYTLKGSSKGVAPKDDKLRKIFTQSGFYNFVSTSQLKNKKVDNMLHKERDYKVRPQIAKSACITGMNHALGTCQPFEPLYEILVECMQNTNNHASQEHEEKCKWWLFVYNCPDTGVSKYSFLDLGVGIFESLIVKNFILKSAKAIGVLPNNHFVKDLLEGNIQSRIEKDNEIRGKGIPQIVNHASFEEFKKFVIITNDVKIDLKNKSSVPLRSSFSGTFYYWELQKTKNAS